MSFQRFKISGLILFCFLAITPCSYGQNSVADSIELSKAGKNAKADEIYFDALKAIMHEDDRQAVTLLKEFTELKPNVSAGWYELSKLSLGDKNLDKASEYVKKALDLDPENKWYKEEYATILANLGSFIDAAKLMAELAKSVPQDKNYPLLAADYYQRAKKYDEALSWIDKALVRNANDEEILMQKVQIYLAMSKTELAADVVNQLIVREPKNGKYYKWLGDLYDNNKMPGKATDVYKQAMKIVPGDVAVQYGLARHYLLIGDTASYRSIIKSAIENKEIDAETQLSMLTEHLQTLPSDSIVASEGVPIVRQLISQHPDDPQVLLLYGELMEGSNKRDSATLIYKRVVAIKPGKFEYWEKLLNGLTDKKDADTLVRYSEKAMRLFPNVAVVSYYNSIGYMNKKDYPHAIAAIKRAIDIQPETDKQVLGQMYSLLADLYHSNKQDDLSDKAFVKALEFNPSDPSVLNNYSYYLSERGVKLEEAEKMSQKSLDLRPNEGTFLDTYGWVQYKKGNYLKAKDFVERAIKLAGEKADATLYDHLGNICYQLNEKDKAVEYWKISKEKGGDDPLIDKKISEGKLYE
jgi:tetratricopeptide (TPR) repeat protein